MPQWTLTVPVEKSEHDGGRYLIGIAAGPGVDAQFDRITPEAIQRFSAQISQSPIPLRNFHKTDDITADLGDVTKAWITDTGELGVEILLDEDNKDSDFIWKKISKGKQYGLSIHGDATDYHYEHDPASAARVRVLNDVKLDEISITTRPAFTPSFGTVVRKSIEDAENEGNALETESIVDAVVEETTTDDTVAKTAEVETATPVVPETEEVEVEKSADAAIATANVEFLAFGKDFKNLMARAESLGLFGETATETTASVDATDTPVVEHSTAIETLESEVSKSRSEITELRALVESLREQIPSTQLPPAQVSKSDSTEELAKLMAEMSPMDRVRFGLALKGR